MHRTNSWLTLVAVVLVAAYAAFVGRGEQPRAPAPPPIGAGAEPASAGEQPEPATVVVSVPVRADRPSKPLFQPQPAASLPEDSVVLVREIQRELQRVGCYDRAINGIWTTSSRMAAQTFTERVNARLPIDTPDLALLSLLQSQPQRVCARPCSQAQDGTSRCPAGATEAGTPASSREAGALAAPAPESQPERRSADAEAPAKPRFAQPAAKKAALYWRSLVRSVDRALGLY